MTCPPGERTSGKDGNIVFVLRTLGGKRKRRIIVKHVAMRLSFTITTTNFWRPDMNDCDRHAHIPNFPVFSFPLPTNFLIISHATGKTLIKNFLSLSQTKFPLSHCSLPLLTSPWMRTTALSVRHTRSLSVRLSFAQHKSPRRVMFTIFSSPFRVVAAKREKWEVMCWESS